RLAVRNLAKTPFVSLVAILSLALGIGANSAIFSLFNQMLLRPLPVPAPHELVNLGAPGPKPGSTSCQQAGDCEQVFSYPMFRDLERLQTSFAGIAAHRMFGANLAYKGQTEGADGVLVSGSFFPVLGLQPAIGRLFTPEDDKTPGGHPLAVLTYDYWRRRFQEDPGVLGQTLIVNGHAFTIIGVTPRGFEGTVLGTQPSVYVPITMRGEVQSGSQGPGFENRRAYWAYLFARLKPGVTRDQALAALNGAYRPIINDVEAPLQTGMSDQTMARFRAKELTVVPGARGQSTVHREARAPLIILLAVTGTVLLIACANIANLLLARGAGRAAEMAVRLSIGASRAQLVRQLLTESVVLALLGATLGVLVAKWTLDVIAALVPPEAAAIVAFKLDPTMLAFAALLAVVTGLVFGLFPALHSTKPELAATLKNQAGQPSGAKAAKRFRATLATAQIALSMALLAPAGLFAMSLLNVSRVDLGIKPDHLITFAVAPVLNGYDTPRARALFERMEEQLAALPGASSAGFSMVPLLSGDNWNNDMTVEGFEAGPDTNTNAAFNSVGPDFFRTVEMPLVSGRAFTPADGAGAPKVVIVNQAFTRRFNLGPDAVGRRIKEGRGEGPLDMEIVGVVQDAKYSDVKRAVGPQYFTPYRQEESVGFGYFYVRTALDPEQLLTAVPGVVKALDPNLPIEELKTMETQIRENVFMDRMISVLSTGFALLATLLAAIGLYGVLAYTVAQRTREFGVRMALGADGVRVRGLVLRQVAVMAVIGGLIGLAAAVGIGQAAKSLLFEIEGYDPRVLAASAAVLAVVTLAAGYLPALRASRIDPMKALRYE
ncbi:MAG: ABC transporter permease, partial [Vicinamibacterales bacterium]